VKHAVILAHPKSGSFCASIARTCGKTLEALGHEVVFRDLYAMRFDPCLRADEIPAATGFQPHADVVAERQRLAGVDSLIFVYPFWFNAPPAILKGYVDRVFGMGFGYGRAVGGNTPLLDDKTLLTFSTSGAPDQWVQDTGALKALMLIFDLHLSGVCGLRVLDHVHLGGVSPNMAQEPAQDLLEDVRAALNRTFAPAAPERLRRVP
jgi:NAD(P)H dehydrogenase (quinone)